MKKKDGLKVVPRFLFVLRPDGMAGIKIKVIIW